MEYFFMYMLRCADESFYIGHTDNLNKRISEHQAGAYCCYTKSRLPIEVVYVQTFTSRYEALVAERKIKGWRRAKKEALIRADWNEISRLASRRKDRAVAQGPSFETQAKPAPQDERGEGVLICGKVSGEGVLSRKKVGGEGVLKKFKK